MTTAVLAYDGFPSAGLGHRRRMEVLGRALRERGVSVELLSTDALVAGLKGIVDLLVVDAYSVRADRLNVGTCPIAAVDDLERDLAVSVVVDPAPGARASDHPSARTVLAGAQYALVVPSPSPPRAVAGVAETVLVTAGAVDRSGVARALATGVRAALPRGTVRLVVSRADAVPPDGVVPILAPAGLEEHLAAADIVLTAGGVTMLEALHAGRPTVVVVTAANQRRQALGAADAGAAVLSTEDKAVTDVTRLWNDFAERARLAAAAASLVDGGGPDRVADALCRAIGR